MVPKETVGIGSLKERIQSLCHLTDFLVKQINFPYWEIYLLLYLTIYIIRDYWNTEFHTHWFSGVLANTVALTPILCIPVKTSELGGCCYVPFSLLGPSSYLWVKAKVWFFRWLKEFINCSLKCHFTKNWHMAKDWHQNCLKCSSL